MSLIDNIRSYLGSGSSQSRPPSLPATPPSSTSAHITEEDFNGFDSEIDPSIFDELEAETSTIDPTQEKRAKEVEKLRERLDRYRCNLEQPIIHSTDGIAGYVKSLEDPDSVTNHPDIQDAAEKFIVRLLQSSNAKERETAIRIQRAVPLAAERTQNNTTLINALHKAIDGAEKHNVHDMVTAFFPKLEDLEEIVRERIYHWIDKGHAERARSIVDARIIDVDQHDPAIQHRAKQRMITAFSSDLSVGECNVAKWLSASFEFSQEFIGLYATYHYALQYHKRNTYAERLLPFHVNVEGAGALLALLGDKEGTKVVLRRTDYEAIVEHAPEKIRPLFERFELKNLEQVTAFGQEYPDFMRLLFETPEEELTTTNSDIQLSRDLRIYLREIEELRRGGVDVQVFADEKDSEGLFQALCQHGSVWQDTKVIAEPFALAAKTFGYRQMFHYGYQKRLSRHDTVDGIDTVVRLVEATETAPKDFYNKILLQVKKDGADYQEGRAHHHLIAITSGFQYDIEATLAAAQRYKRMQAFLTLLKTFDSKESIFASWDNLQRYAKLQQMVQEQAVLNDLQEVQVTNPRKYDYISQIVFHKFSKVNIEAAIQIGTAPLKYLGGDDGHSPGSLHARKKPSNYVEIPHLDLTAEQLVDALVDGTLDVLQAHTPMIVRYEIPVGFDSIRASLKTALGSYREKIPGFAQNSKKLFAEVKNILFEDERIRAQNISKKDVVNRYIAGADATSETEHAIFNLVYQSDIGMPNVEKRVYTAQIHLKSDPMAVLAGDDTACCMRFGSGKNTVYTFNLNTTLFTVQRQLDDGRFRTIAQSVMTTDMDIMRPIPEIMSYANSQSTPLVRVIPEEILVEDKHYLTCDNIEVARNYTSDDDLRCIEVIYGDFFSRYLQLLGKAQNLRDETLLIGKGYTTALSSLPVTQNTFAPLAPVSYSDNVGPQVLTMGMDGRTIPFAGQPKKRKRARFRQAPPTTPGISYLTHQDTLTTAYLEGRVYSDNESLMEYLHNIENGLIAKDINNVAKRRPNLSFKYTDPKGRIWGYMIAYEGIFSAEGEGAELKELDGEPIIYIQDIASDKGSRLAGGKLLTTFFELYARYYLKRNRPIPVFAEMREKTSYKLIRKKKKQIERHLSQTFGKKVDLVIEERGTSRCGSDQMHHVVIRPVISG